MPGTAALRMERIVRLAAGALGMFLGLISSQAMPANPPEAPASKFRAGQVWAFKAPSDQAKARLTVLKVEDGGKLGIIVHIALAGLSLPKGQNSVSHMPFREDAVARSVTSLEQEAAPLPDFAEGYRKWRIAHDAGEAGVFTLSVAEGIEVIARSLGSPK